MNGLIGKKLGMTSLFDANGKRVACTVVEAGPCVVTQVKTLEKDGYNAIQMAYGDKKERRASGAAKGHAAKAKTNPKQKLVEFRDNDADLELGGTIDVSIFEEGEFVDVVGTSKGKGFQGVVKRHGFGGVGQRTHGQHNRERAPGSIGAASYPARVFKGMRMAGQMGNAKTTIQNLVVMKVDTDKNLLVLSGSVPGPKNSYIIVEK